MPDYQLNVHYLPGHIAERELALSTVVVIDVLRATSTICQALASGAREVVPFVEVEEALAAAAKAGRKNVVLGGERKGVLIPGFDLANSPTEYTPEAVRGRRVFITTTNGTRALQHARLAKKVVIGSFLNLSAVVAALKNEPRVDILCAGTDGSETSEDVLLAGAIVHKSLSQNRRGLAHIAESSEQNVPVPLSAEGSGIGSKLMIGSANVWIPDDCAKSAREEWQALLLAVQTSDNSVNQLVESVLGCSPGGRNLGLVGNSGDIPVCAHVDSLSVVPLLNVHDWKITAS